MFSLQKAVKFIQLISKKAVNNQCYAKYVFSKAFKNSVELLWSLFPVMLQTFFTQEHLGLRRALGGTRALKKTLERLLGTTKTLKVHLSTRTLDQL